MSEKIRILYYALWIAHPVFEAGIAGFMLWRGLHRKFRYFFAYIITQIFSFAVVFGGAWHSYDLQFYLYWSCSAVSAALGFGVIYEVFIDVFRSFHTLRDLGTVLFKWAGLVMLLVAGVVSISTNSMEMPPWMQAIMTTQRCVRIIQVGMVLFLLFFANYLGVSRRQRSFGIALGFGAFAVVELSLVASFAGHHLSTTWMSIFNMTIYNASLTVWLGYMALKSPVREDVSSLLRPQRWEQSLSDIHNPLPPDSLIPMFEGMVDRALSRTQPESTLAAEKPMYKTAAAAVGFDTSPARATSKT